MQKKPARRRQARRLAGVTTARVFDEKLRFTVPDASYFLSQSPAKTWRDIKDGTLSAIRDAGRTYVPGTEIVRRSRIGAP